MYMSCWPAREMILQESTVHVIVVMLMMVMMVMWTVNVIVKPVKC